MVRYETPNGQCLSTIGDVGEDLLPRVDLFDGGKKIGMPSLDAEREFRSAETYFPAGKVFTALAIYGDGSYPGWQYSCLPIVRFTPEAGKDYEFSFDYVVLEPGRHNCVVTLDELKPSGTTVERISTHFDYVLSNRSPLCRKHRDASSKKDAW